MNTIPAAAHNPFDPTLHGGVMFDHDGPVEKFDDGAAKVRFRVKGSSLPGIVYQGQKVFQGCAGCGTAPPPAKDFVHRIPEPFREHPSRGPRALVWPWLSTAADWDELRYSLRSVHTWFRDRESPIYIIGDAAPAWLRPGGRVEFIHVPEYQKSQAEGMRRAREIMLQIADEVMVWNDDIYLLQSLGWDFFDAGAIVQINLTGQGDMLRADPRPYRRNLGTMIKELEWAGVPAPHFRFGAHTPFRFERAKSREILRLFEQTLDGGFSSLYHNFHRTPPLLRHQSLRTDNLADRRRKTMFFNHPAGGPSAADRRALAAMFPDPAPWESGAVD